MVIINRYVDCDNSVVGSIFLKLTSLSYKRKESNTKAWWIVGFHSKGSFSACTELTRTVHYCVAKPIIANCPSIGMKKKVSRILAIKEKTESWKLNEQAES